MSDSKKLQALCEKQKWKCYYCKKVTGPNKPIGKRPSLDHKIPKSRGGRNAYFNLVMSCEDCNNMKGNFTDGEFFKMLDYMHDYGMSKKDARERVIKERLPSQRPISYDSQNDKFVYDDEPRKRGETRFAARKAHDGTSRWGYGWSGK